MTEEKKSKNPFVNMANDAKKQKAMFTPNKQPNQKTAKANTKGFGGSNVIRRTGRGG
jgi:hypothetical protein